MEYIISHTNADFDSLACMVAARMLYPAARLCFTSSPEQAVKNFMAIHKDFIKVDNINNIDFTKINKLILVDVRTPSRLSKFKDLVNNPQTEIHIYDHHQPSQESIVGDVNIIKNYGAAITIFVEIFKLRQIPISSLEATLYALAIYEETGSLTFSTTTKEDVLAVAYLLEQGAKLNIVSDFIYHILKPEQKTLLNSLISASYTISVKGLQVVIAMAKTESYVDELALLTHRLLDIERVDAIFSLVNMRERTYIVARSRSDEVNVSAVLSPFGGGGHATAASATVKEKNLEKLATEIEKALENITEPVISAKDIMSFPVITMNIDDKPTVFDAQKMMGLYGISGIVIVKDKNMNTGHKRALKPVENGEIVGMISRKDVDKAVFHGLEKAPVSSYMTKEVIALPANTPLSLIQKTMISKDIGRIPIVEEGVVVGIITRNDILKTLHGVELRKGDLSPGAPVEYIYKLPSFIRNIFEISSSIAQELDSKVFLIGGFVRDLFLGVNNLDLDFVVEGDGIEFGKRLAMRLLGRCRSHEKFQTAMVILDNDLKIDIATARTEYYTRPAALPEVRGSSLKQDLYRRDFTINTMAISLEPDSFGRLVDFFGGKRDIRQGIVRVLHNLSFIDDPTRIFRAIRFEQRYHFRMDQNTEGLLREAISMDIFSEMPNERIRDELILMLEEARPLPAIKRMAQLKILRLIHTNLQLNSKVLSILENVTATLVQFEELIESEKIERWIIYFSALISQLGEDEVKEITLKYHVSTAQMKKIAVIGPDIGKILHHLSKKDLQTSKTCYEVEGLSLEAILYLLARTQNHLVKQRLSKYLTRWRKIGKLVKGRDIKNWGYEPGPFFKKALKLLNDAFIDGLIKTKEDARTYLLKDETINLLETGDNEGI